MKIAEFDRVVTDYAISHKKAGNVKVHINVHPDIYSKRWVKGEYDRTYLKVRFTVDVWTNDENFKEKEIWVNCGFINNKTNRYSINRETDFRKDDAFSEVDETIAEFTAELTHSAPLPKKAAIKTTILPAINDCQVADKNDKKISNIAKVDGIKYAVVERGNKFYAVKGKTQTPLFPGLQHKSYAQAVYDIYDFMIDNNINCPIDVERLISQIDEGVLV
nr:MAG TPA: hypothetical protein [Caudoviricetes sp.]